MWYRKIAISPTTRSFSSLALAFVLTCLAGQQTAHAELSNLARTPLFLTANVAPNVFIELDDSGSMDWEILTTRHWHACNYWLADCAIGEVSNGLWSSESLFGGLETFEYMFDEDDHAYSGSCTRGRERLESCGLIPTLYDWRILSSDFNVLYYNPRINYKPWSGTGLTDASFSAARSNPQEGTGGYSSTRNLRGFSYEIWQDNRGYSGERPGGLLNLNITTEGNGEIDLWDSHIRVIVTDIIILEIVNYEPVAEGLENPSTIRQTLTHLPESYCLPACSGGRTMAEERQNIANWYQYARRRSFIAKSAIAEVVKQHPGYRYGLSVINEYDDLFKPVPSADISDFASHNRNLLTGLFDFSWPSRGTPLRKALKRTGEYFKSLYEAPIVNECQQNFALLMTDGYWNGDDPQVGDEDADGTGNTLADVAYRYYHDDLRPDLADQVPVNAFDDNDKQHMVTFTAAFGVEGVLQDSGSDGWPDVANINLSEQSDWGDPGSCSDCPEKIDDLWHAAYNSRGQFVSARTPRELVDGLQATLATIANRLSSASAVATTASVLRTDTRVFQARFDSSDWSGQLRAMPVNPDGSIGVTADWDSKAPDSEFNGQNWHSGRRIITYKPSTGQGIAFRWPADPDSPGAGDLDPQQIAALNDNPYTSGFDDDGYGEQRLHYLRGARDNETSAGGYRKRSSMLGDLVNSKPLYIGAPFLRYPDDLESASYQSFKQTYADRTALVYVGGNDGMLHGFNARTGKEEIAFVPARIFEHLNQLTRPDYTHRFFVDGPLTAGDAFLPDRAGWGTLLVGALGGGGQGLFALDITEPGQFDSETSARASVLWEFNDADDADLGFTFGRPTIIKTAAGPWAVVTGNGYNSSQADEHASATGHAVLYVLDAASGQILRKIDTGVGSTDSPNALAAPEAIDANRDAIADFIYAGDYYGNLWAFDVRASDPARWHIAYDKPLFTTASGQPVTTRALVSRHPDEQRGYLVYFGTGSYLYENDHTSAGQSTQSVYAVWDRHQPVWDNSQNQWMVWDKNRGDAGEWVEANPQEDEKVTLAATLTRAQLLAQNVLEETAEGWRMVSDWPVQWLRDSVDDNRGQHLGWFLDFIVDDDNKGERLVTELAVRNQRLVFNTLAPSNSSCASAGNSWLMVLNAENGGRLKKPAEENGRIVVRDVSAFDVNGDGQLTFLDPVVAGRRQSDLEFGPGLIVELPDISHPVIPELGHAITNTSGGDLNSTAINLGKERLGRQTWQQLIR